jgi:WD40 repeat protein
LAIYDTATGDVVLEPRQIDVYPCCLGMLVWNRDDSRLHVGGQDGTLRTLDTATWQVVSEQVLNADQTALRLGQLSADGTQVIVPTEAGSVYLIDASSGELIGEPFLASGTQFQIAAIAANGTMMIAQGRDGKLRLWDVASRRAIGPAMGGHFEFVTSLDLLSESSAVSGGAVDGTTITWTLDPVAWAERACEIAGRNLTLGEWATYVGGEYQRTCEQWPDGT